MTRAWSLSVDGPDTVGNNALVRPVRMRDGSLAVLRVGNRHDDAADGWRVLQRWNGDGAVHLLDHDAADDVSLLERADWSRDLDSLPVADAVVVAANLRRRLDLPAVPGFRTLEALAAQWTLDLPDAAALPADLRDHSTGLCRELGPGARSGRAQ